jgi:stearoyl-CoA desaturase (Delta-9 desaturase)
MQQVSALKASLINIAKQCVFFGVHLGCLGILFVGISWTAALACLFFYVLRMFAITAGYHRYFAHRSYKTSRVFQFLLALLGSSAAQKGPLWWASHHRHHHQHSDTEQDIHSAHVQGIWWSHVGWVLSTQYLEPRVDLIKDFLKYKEIRLIDQFNALPPIFLAVGIFLLGEFFQAHYPALQTNGFQMLVWGFFVSTTLVYHGTFLVNSVTHLFGRKRFETSDESRNSLIIALVTMGEGWHNNHHRYPGSERQGFYWWEIDSTHYILKLLSLLGIVWDLREPPARIYAEAAERQAVLIPRGT